MQTDQSPSPCAHENFAATVNVARLEDTGRFMAEVRVRCTQCNRPFQFLGLEAGLDLNGARVSVDGLEANIAICPQGEQLSPLDNMIVNMPFLGRSKQ